jgi:hypothetical protein
LTAKDELAEELGRFQLTQTEIDNERLIGLTVPFFKLFNYYKQNPCRSFDDYIYSIADDFQGILSVLSIVKLLTKSPERKFSKIEVRSILQLFFFEVNSIFDFLLTAACIAFDVPVKETYHFSKREQRLISKLGTSDLELRMIALLNNCEIFEPINTWRNYIAHKGRFIDVVEIQGATAFKVIIPGAGEIERWNEIPREVFIQNRFVDINVFIGLYAGRLLHYLNRWSELILERQNIDVTYGGYSSAPHLNLLEQAIRRAHQLL